MDGSVLRVCKQKGQRAVRWSDELSRSGVRGREEAVISSQELSIRRTRDLVSSNRAQTRATFVLSNFILSSPLTLLSNLLEILFFSDLNQLLLRLYPALYRQAPRPL